MNQISHGLTIFQKEALSPDWAGSHGRALGIRKVTDVGHNLYCSEPAGGTGHG
jgi:hypothetical protein